MQIELRASAPEDTKMIGRELAELLRAGDAVALTGELGAGKTTFVQGVALGLGFEGHVVSPTFTLVREYRARLTLIHVDVYRLERMQDVIDLGLDDALGEGDAVVLIEWGDAVEGLLPQGHLVVELTVPGAGEERRLVLRGTGEPWVTRWERLEQVTEPWAVAA
jgi:tRNA threonylcarbamoyladenosine biosynthesis protein TsaE